MKTLNRIYASLVFSMLLALSACAQLGLPQAENFDERLAAGYSLNAQVRTTAAELLNAKKISKADGENVLEQTNNFRTGLDIARTLSGTDIKAADGKLSAIRAALLAVQSYLAIRKGN